MLSNITHFWCPLCDAIQPAFFEGFDNIDVSGQFVGGDIVCETCRLVIATAYDLIPTTIIPPLDSEPPLFLP
jgi:hypothetical protein